jgi:hypothetical protein
MKVEELKRNMPILIWRYLQIYQRRYICFQPGRYRTRDTESLFSGMANLVEETAALDYGNTKTAEQILANTNVIDSIDVDEEAMQFYLDCSLDELWKSAFREEQRTILTIK